MRIMRLAASILMIVPALLSQTSDARRVLTFADEFEGRQLDLARWIPHDPFGAMKSPAVAEVSGRQLRLNGVIATFSLFSQLYGRFEIRCRMPRSRGASVRVRLLPIHLAELAADASVLPSIDLLEAGANGPARIFFGNHWGTEQTERSYGDWFDAPDLSAAFHTIALEWDRERIVWSIDGKDKFKSVDGIPQQPMFLEIASEAEGGAPLEIDYVRVYQSR